MSKYFQNKIWIGSPLVIFERFSNAFYIIMTCIKKLELVQRPEFKRQFLEVIVADI